MTAIVAQPQPREACSSMRVQVITRQAEKQVDQLSAIDCRKLATVLLLARPGRNGVDWSLPSGTVESSTLM